MAPQRLSEETWVKYGTGALPLRSEDDLVAVIRAGIDDSANKAEDVKVVAMYAATSGHWVKLGRKWVKTLTKFDVDPPVFHMTDYANREGSFRHLRGDDERWHALIQKLIALIRKHTMVGVTFGLPTKELEDALRGRNQGEAAELLDPYSLCMVACLIKYAQFKRSQRKKLPRRRVRCTIDKVPGKAGLIGRVFEGFVERNLPDVIDHVQYGFGSAATDIPIQVADVVAYEVMKELDNRVIRGVQLNRHGEPFERRKSLVALTREGVNLHGGYYDPEFLRHTLSQAWLDSLMRDREEAHAAVHGAVSS